MSLLSVFEEVINLILGSNPQPPRACFTSPPAAIIPWAGIVFTSMFPSIPIKVLQILLGNYFSVLPLALWCKNWILPWCQHIKSRYHLEGQSSLWFWQILFLYFLNDPGNSHRCITCTEGVWPRNGREWNTLSRPSSRLKPWDVSSWPTCISPWHPLSVAGNPLFRAKWGERQAII